MVVKQQEIDFRINCLEYLQLPPRFDKDSIFARVREIGETGPNRESKRSIDEEAVNLLESWQRSEEQQPGTELVREGKGLFRAEVASFRRRFGLLREQRELGLQWSLTCILRGNLPVEVAETLANVCFWENAFIDVVEQIILPEGLEAVNGAHSRKDLDVARRRARAEVIGLGLLGDRAVEATNRLVLTVDLWNSATIDQVYVAKTWEREALARVNLEPLLSKTHEAVSILREALFEGYGRTRVDSSVRLHNGVVPFARALSEALTEEAAA